MAKTDGVCHCLLTARHGHGSELQLLVVVEGGRVRVRHLSVVECGLLMGSSGDWTRFRKRDALTGLGDGVIVPAVRWMDRHILRPIAAGIANPAPPAGLEVPDVAAG